jgi:site-specific DNA-methyltransferase (adenine-specific)
MKPDTLMLCFYGWQAVDRFMAAWRAAGLRPVDHMVAYKGYVSSSRYFHRCHEQAFLLAKGNPPTPPGYAMLDDVRARWNYTGNRHHPCEKPVPNLRELVECFCRPGGLVLDPFAGSGSSGVAALEAGRRFLGIEIDAECHAAAVARLSACGKDAA